MTVLRSLAGLAALTLSLLIVPVVGAADAEPRCSVAAWTAKPIVVDCVPGYATPHDEITIFARSAYAAATHRLPALMIDAVWLFEPGAAETAALIIDFHAGADGALVADLYDDGDGDGVVGWVLHDDLPVSIENRGRPTLTVTAADGWWQRGRRTNFNLDLTVDGPVRASFFSFNFLGLLKNDGAADFEIHVRDRAGTGQPDYEWTQFLPPLPEGIFESGHYRTELVVNDEHDEVPLTGSLLWPYLAARPRQSAAGEYVKSYNESPPPIEVDWQRGRIVQINEFVASRGNPGSYFIYSIARVAEGTLSVTDFENPFAFYDLAGARDGWPDMSIRVEVTLPVEVPHLRIDRPIVIAEYSWDQHHDHHWTYALNVVGQPPIDETITLPDFGVTTVPPPALPGWVSEQDWDAATFVEVTHPYWTTEHVYEYTVEQGDKVLLRYLAGLDSSPPVAAFATIAPGFRGERAFHLNGPARLYVSPVDGRLHLLGAEAGQWNMGDGRELRYESVGGTRIDHWTAREGGHTESDLYTLADQAVYLSSAGVYVGALSQTTDPLRLAAPRDGAEWASLGKLVAAAAPDFAPDDLRAMFDAATTDSWRLPGAKAREFRSTDDGFQFVLRLAGGPTTAKWAAGAPAGNYFVRYRVGSGYTLEALEPASLGVSAVEVVGGAKAGEQAQLSFGVVNDGQRHAGPLVADIEAWRAGEQPRSIGSAIIEVAGGQRAEATLSWLPPDDGNWLVRAVLPRYGVNGPVRAIAVAAAPVTHGPVLTNSQDLPAPVIEWSYLVLFALTLGAAAVALRVVPATRARSPQPATLPVAYGAGPVAIAPPSTRWRVGSWSGWLVGGCIALVGGAEIAIRAGSAAPAGVLLAITIVVAINQAAFAGRNAQRLLIALALVALLRILALVLPALLDDAVESVGLAAAAAVPALLLAVRRLQLGRVELGLTVDRRAVVLAALLAPAGLAAGMLLSISTGTRLLPPAAFAADGLPVTLAVLLVAGLVEAIIFFGLFQAAATRYLGTAIGIGLSAVLFALLAAPSWQPVPLALALLVGGVLGVSVASSRSLVPALVVHAGVTIGLLALGPMLWGVS